MTILATGQLVKITDVVQRSRGSIEVRSPCATGECRRKTTTFTYKNYFEDGSVRVY